MQLAAILLLAAETAGLVLFFLLGITSWKAYRLSGAPPLRRFLVGFGAMAAAQAAAIALEVSTNLTPRIQPRLFDHLDVLFWTYYVLILVACASILSTFDRRKYKWVLAMGPLLLVAGPLLQVLVLVLLFLIVIHAGLNHIERSRLGSLQTALGFFLLLLAHFVFLFGYRPLGPRNLLGELVAIAGLVLLYLAARWPRGAEP